MNAPKKLELVAAEVQTDFTPKALMHDDYYYFNDQSQVREREVKEEILELQKDMKLWLVNIVKEYAQGKSITALAKQTKRSEKVISKHLNTLQSQKLIHHWQHLEVVRDGPNEVLRKHMLWRIAVDNERTDPKEATKALAELNKMTAQNKGGGQSFQIVINNEILQKGPLDE